MTTPLPPPPGPPLQTVRLRILSPSLGQARATAAAAAMPTLVESGYVVLALESGVVSLGGAWFETTALLLRNAATGESYHTFTQTTTVDAWAVERALEQTPMDYARRDSGVRLRPPDGAGTSARGPHLTHGPWWDGGREHAACGRASIGGGDDWKRPWTQ